MGFLSRQVGIDSVYLFYRPREGEEYFVVSSEQGSYLQAAGYLLS